MQACFIYWQPDPVAFSLGPLAVRWYGLSWAASIWGLYALGRVVFKREGKPVEDLADIVQFVFLGAFIGARVAQVLFYEPAYFFAHPEEIPAIWHGGLSSHGAVAGGILGMLLFARKHREYDLMWLLDRLFLVGLLSAGLIRLGNFMNAELPGIPTDLPWGIISPAYGLIPRHPVVLYEAAISFAMLGCQWLLYRRYKGEIAGLHTAFFLSIPYMFRFLAEFFKEPEGGLFLGVFSRTQLLHLPLICGGIILFILIRMGKINYRKL